jgi:anti-sigma28 factor (negative regulator of flagellin synthesis)
MRIEDLYAPAVRSAHSSGQRETSAEAERWKSEGLSDAVYLSRLSQILLSAGAKAGIERLRELVARGEYRISAIEISRRIVEFYLEADGDLAG